MPSPSQRAGVDRFFKPFQVVQEYLSHDSHGLSPILIEVLRALDAYMLREFFVCGAFTGTSVSMATGGLQNSWSAGNGAVENIGFDVAHLWA